MKVGRPMINLSLNGCFKHLQTIDVRFRMQSDTIRPSAVQTRHTELHAWQRHLLPSNISAQNQTCHIDFATSRKRHSHWRPIHPLSPAESPRKLLPRSSCPQQLEAVGHLPIEAPSLAAYGMIPLNRPVQGPEKKVTADSGSCDKPQ